MRLALPRQLRLAPVPAILAAAMVVVSALVFQAWRAQQENRATVGHALGEYASFAAWEFASNAKEEMWLAATELLRPVEQLDPADSARELPSADVLVRAHERVVRCQCAYDIPAAYYFRLDLGPRRLSVAGAKEHPTDAEQRWLIDTLTLHARSVFGRSWRVATIVGAPGASRRTVSYAVVRDSSGEPRAAYGVVSESNAFLAAFAAELSQWSLLPPALAKQAGTDTLVSIVVRDDLGHVVYRSPWQYRGYAASYPLTKFGAGFTVEATLRGDVAPRLVIGGRSNRLPVLVALLALTAVLFVIAVRQHRRETALARMRADFVSSVSHELRTPLAQIRMFADLLRMGWTRSERERERSLEIIDQEAHRLGLLVERVLAFDRTEQAEPVLALERESLAPLVSDALDAFAPLAAARGVALESRLEPGVAAMVDRGALRQILVNLLDNAVKYGAAGQPVVVSLRARGAFARLTVDDSGPGVPVADRELVWEPFRRLARDAGSSVAGSGIGLALVRRLASAHGGRTAVESAPSGGARFLVDLPRIVEAPVAPAPIDAPAAAAGSAA